MKPEKLAESGTESGQQRALFAAVNGVLWQLYCQECDLERTTNIEACTPGDINAAKKWDGVNRLHLSPLKYFHSIPNGGSRGDTARARAIRGATMKAEGVKAGIPDTFLPVPRWQDWKRGRDFQVIQYAGLYIEMKKPGGRPSIEQLAFRDYALSVGYQWKLCDNWEDAYNELITYLT